MDIHNLKFFVRVSLALNFSFSVTNKALIERIDKISARFDGKNYWESLSKIGRTRSKS